jgi:hypothetical protein
MCLQKAYSICASRSIIRVVASRLGVGSLGSGGGVRGGSAAAATAALGSSLSVAPFAALEDEAGAASAAGFAAGSPPDAVVDRFCGPAEDDSVVDLANEAKLGANGGGDGLGGWCGCGP